MKFFLPCALALSLLLATGASRAEVTLNLKDADIGTLIQTVSEVTGRNFIVDPRVKGKVTVISSSPMSDRALYQTFLAVLQVQGFAAIPSGAVTKIVPETNARQDGSGLDTSAYAGSDEVITHVYAIENVSAAQLVPILRPLVPQWGHLAAYAPSNMLIIADRAANIQRLSRLIRQIDQSTDRGIEVVKLEHASAPEVVQVLSALQQNNAKGAEPGTQAVAVIADERSNSVLIAGDKAERQKMLDVLGSLDVPIGEGGTTQVVYLRYASAENLAPVLEGYAQQVSRQAGGATGNAQQRSGAAGGNNNEVRVLAETDTNAIIITAPPKPMKQIRNVIAQLDIRRAQVLVEGVIAEVGDSKSGSLGIDWAVFNQNSVAAAGLLDPNTASALSTAAAAGADLDGTAALGLLGNGINITAGRSGTTTLAVLVKALRGDGDSNVLSTPTLVTLDNEEAEISVGQEVPFLTGSFSNTGATGGSTLNPFQTIERKDVGLTLGITPQINEGNNIKLKLKLEVSSLASGSTGTAVDLITNKRTLTNTVSVEDGQVLVLGGLIDDQLNETQRSVPVLGAIPLLGNLFRYRSIQKDKRNLMIFIKPAILRKKSEGNYYSRLKYDSLRKLQRESAGEGPIPLIGGQRVYLEPYDAFSARGDEVRSAASNDSQGRPQDAVGEGIEEAQGTAKDALAIVPEAPPPLPTPKRIRPPGRP